MYGRVSRNISFLTIPPHSQLIHNHDAEVYAPIAACSSDGARKRRLTNYFDGLLDSLEHVFSRKNCKFLVHNFFQRKMKGHFKRVFLFHVLLSKNS